MDQQPLVPASIDWAPGEPPRSRDYGDVYFSRDDGLEESRSVFLAGCGLPEDWTGRRRFTVGELGFGTGLNIVALIDLWRRARPADGRLHVFSIEAHPLTRGDAARALSAWPEVADTASRLLHRWPRKTRGFHRIDLEDLGATIDVAIMDVAIALENWSGAADAWFLDGFSPALNPDMWRAEVIDLIAARSAPGARVATYTVASAVRRNLVAAGFQVARKPGFGRKRERLEARLETIAAPAPTSPRVAIVGGGVAAALLRRAFGALGVRASAFTGPPGAASASAGPAALVAPRLDAGLGPHASLFAQAFHRAVDLYEEVAETVISRGLIQLAADTEDSVRFCKIAASGLFEADATRLIDSEQASTLLAETSGDGIVFDDAVVVEPAGVLAAWLGDDAIPQTVSAIRKDDRSWRLTLESGVDVAFEIVVVAGGYASNALIPDLGLGAVRGQASCARGDNPPFAILSGGYAIPTRTGVMFGATNDRADTGTDEREGDHARNLTTLGGLSRDMAARNAEAPLTAHVGTRATTKDFMPLAGAVDPEAPGLFVLTGLGSRGYCLAPLLAEHVAAMAMDAPSPIPRTSAALVDPGRFARRAERSRHRRR